MKLLKYFIKLGIAAGVFWYLISSEILDFGLVISISKNYHFVFGFFILYICLIIPLMSIRWWFLLKALGIELSLGRSFRITWISLFFNSLLPGAVSGDLIKGYYVYHGSNQKKKGQLALTILVDRVVGLFGLVTIGVIASLLNTIDLSQFPEIKMLRWVVYLLFVSMLVFFCIMLHPFESHDRMVVNLLKKLPKSDFFIKTYNTFRLYKSQKKALYLSIGVSVLNHMVSGALFIMVGTLIGVPADNLILQFMIFPIGLLVVAFPISPSGMGIGHVAFAALYNTIGIDQGANIFNIFILMQILINSLGGLLYLAEKTKIPKAE